MRIAVLILISLNSLAVFAQSKSKQIELVKSQYDSLSLILENERVVNVKKMTELNDKVLSLQSQQILINSTNLNLNDSLNNSIRKLRFAEEELLRISKQNEQFITEIQGKQEIIDSLLANSVVRSKSKYGDAVCYEISDKIKSCIWEKFMVIRSSEIYDVPGREDYFESTKLYKLIENNYNEILNSQMFLDPDNLLFKIVNDKILEEHKTFIDATVDNENTCYNEFNDKLLHYFSLNTLDVFQIFFNDDIITFYINLNLCHACRSIKHVSVSFKIDDIINYIVLD
jgi:hypothetical protein